MAGALRKTMVYLGLAEDEGYDTYPDEPAGREAGPVEQDERSPKGAQVTPISRGPVARMVPEAPTHGAELHRITTIHPRTYNQAKTIGESFREGTPVIMNLSDMDDADAKRLVDFAAGLVFGLHGAIERVTNKVFLLSPATVEVTGEEPERAPAATFFNQS